MNKRGLFSPLVFLVLLLSQAFAHSLQLRNGYVCSARWHQIRVRLHQSFHSGMTFIPGRIHFGIWSFYCCFLHLGGMTFVPGFQDENTQCKMKILSSWDETHLGSCVNGKLCSNQVTFEEIKKVEDTQYCNFCYAVFIHNHPVPFVYYWYNQSVQNWMVNWLVTLLSKIFPFYNNMHP